jgi:hypothetical protein
MKKDQQTRNRLLSYGPRVGPMNGLLRSSASASKRATCWSGWRIGTMGTITRTRLVAIRRDQTPERSAFFAVAPGTTTRGPCARPTAATTVRRIASAASVFVVPSEFLRILISVFCFLWSGEGL